MQKNMDEIAKLKAILAEKEAMLAEKDAILAEKEAMIETIKAEARAEAVMYLDFSIKAVTTAVTLLKDNKRWDLAYLLMPILDQLKGHRMEITHMFLPQMANQLDRPKCTDTNTYQAAHSSVQRFDRGRATGNIASGAMVWAPTHSRCSTGHERTDGKLDKDLVNAVLDLYLQVALAS